ncbi:MAG: MerR family transcriptional regulator [Planctomycetota bacterium]|nr:MerR family transcriptional regulator [Planctomycetota bacterium]
MRLLKTGEVLEATGISHQVLYRYATLGLIEEAGTTSGGQRLFHPHVVELIAHIKGLNETGYSLRDIKEIFFKQRRVRRACRGLSRHAGASGKTALPALRASRPTGSRRR